MCDLSDTNTVTINLEIIWDGQSHEDKVQR